MGAFLRRGGGWEICFDEREMERALLMMRLGDGGSLMEYAGEETY